MSKHVINDLSDTGFFNFEIVQQVIDCKRDLKKAKEIAIDAVANYPREASRENTTKAINLIDQAKSVTGLAMQMGSFILAYQGLGTIQQKRK